MGDSFGPRLAALGYRVIYGSRNPTSDKVKTLVAMTGNDAIATTQKDAAQQADVVLLAIPWPAMETVAQNLGDLGGKVVIDMSWPPYEVAEDGYARITIETSAAELIQGWNPDAMVVKAFLTVWSHVIDDPSSAGGPVSIPIASNHRYAKEKTGQIAADLGLEPVDAGPLRFARNIESLAELALVPWYQGRDDLWNLYLPRSNFVSCNGYEGDGAEDETTPIVDAGNLAVMPNLQPSSKPCAN
jgi:predicted dinucleotide-binding enzyme